MLKVCEEVRARHTEDGGILLDVRQGHMFRLNPVGSLILSWLEAGFEESRISEELSRKLLDRPRNRPDRRSGIPGAPSKTGSFGSTSFASECLMRAVRS